MKNVVKRQDVFEALVEADMEHSLLGLQLDKRFGRLREKYPEDKDTDGFDPDAHYTPLEIRLHRLAELFDIDYDAVRAEACRRLTEIENGKPVYYRLVEE
jgi:hypothetical protein